eukprot:scaffold41289_cov24-Cyclotella_meneghiniana.AAC.2
MGFHTLPIYLIPLLSRAREQQKWPSQPEFPGLSTVVIGQLVPHIRTEVDCESLFSQTGHLSHPTRARTIAETFERLSMSKHKLSRIYCCRKRKEEYLNINSIHEAMFAGEEEDDNDGDMVQESACLQLLEALLLQEIILTGILELDHQTEPELCLGFWLSIAVFTLI